MEPTTSSRRTPTISDDTVLYSIYSDDLLAPSPSTSSHLSSLHSHVLSVISPHLDHYIWQHDPFHLVPVPSGVPHLHGRTRYGDNVEDEWFIVFLLFEICKAIPAVSVRVWDTDGEFLLIEAAYCLPRWLNPENSGNRVFVRGGEVRILDRRVFRENPRLEDAIRVLRSEGVETRASDSVQSAIKRRIGEYPERARRNTHVARVRVPLPVAQVLRHESCLISLAVEGFYDRDVDSMKYASRMERFLRSEGGGVDAVQIAVRMSRAMYGQLVQQNFQAPRVYPMPSREEGPVVYGEAELGMKIACGFEMMYQDRHRAGEEGKGSAWDVFKESLESSGYFEGLLPGSEEYRRLMHEAEERYKDSALHARTSDVLNAPVRRIDEILSSSYSVSDFEGIEIPPSDNDSWLYDGEDELNSALLERQKEMEMYESKRKDGSRYQRTEDDNSDKQFDENNIGDVAKAFEAFVEKVSSFEGAEVPKDRDFEEVGFDVDRFMKSLQSFGGQLNNSDKDYEGHTTSDIDSDDYEDWDAAPDEDGADDIFMQSYSDALSKELKETTLEKSFIRAQRDVSNDEGTSNAVDMYEDLTPVDIDANLLKNLLDSYSSQQGLPGPASNILGSLGLKIPDETSKATQKDK